MLALTLCFVAVLYLVGLRSDRAQTRALTEPAVGQDGVAAPLRERTMASGLSPGSVSVAVYYRGRSASQWAARFRHRTRQLQMVRAHVRRQWKPTVSYALSIASTVYGVPYRDLSSVAYCESRHFVFARNGQYRGLFQEGPMFEHGPFGRFSVWDPLANALTAAYTVAHEGWSQWECKP